MSQKRGGLKIGEAKENATGPRPVLITLTHIDKKRTLLRRFRHIGDNDKFKNIKIDHDKTKEREESIKLYEEAKKQEAADKSGEYLYRVRGPPWERKIRNKEKPVKTTHPPRMTDGKSKTLWPLFKSSAALTKAVKERLQPDPTTWTSHNVRVLCACKARTKAKWAEDSSDVQSQEECGRGARKPRRKQYSESDSSGEEFSPSPIPLQKAPRPVPLPVSSAKLHKAPQLPTPLAAATATTDPPVANTNFRNGVSVKGHELASIKSRMRLLTPGAISEQQGLLDDVSLHVQTMEDFAAWDERLTAHNELMRALVQLKLNWLGKDGWRCAEGQERTAFCPTKMCEAITRAVRQAKAGMQASEADVHRDMTLYLGNATDRCGGRKHRLGVPLHNADSLPYTDSP
ncbi:hypothetical protein LSAT2_002419 [Lamellibrachia satsuma]|nr:hypothetical protein LSAT2_002419 [Lamellibrachia satsuma]